MDALVLVACALCLAACPIAARAPQGAEAPVCKPGKKDGTVSSTETPEPRSVYGLEGGAHGVR